MAQKEDKKNATDSSLWTAENWRNKLSEEEYYILREKGTERPYSGILLNNKEKGIYTCKGCGVELFTSEQKFDSHCGWPSFDNEINTNRIIKQKDTSHGMIRTEIICANCGGHLGHLFDDGPTQSGLRYCVNSLSLNFKSEQNAENLETATFGGGCFWCTEAIFLSLKGVKKVESGYSGGHTVNPSYREVCNGNTGHAEVIQVNFNSNIIKYSEILEIFFQTHDPTTLNRQGADIGTQYRSVIFYHNDKQKDTAEKIIEQLNFNNVFEKPVVTEIKAFDKFYKAEDYHQNYYNLNKEQGYCKAVIVPKLEKFKKIFKEKLK